MATVITKGILELDDGTVLFPHSSADLMYYDNDGATNVLAESSTVEEALNALDRSTSGKVGCTSYYATIGTVFDGTEAPYTQTVNVSGILESDEPFVGLIVDTANPANGVNQEKSFGRISRIETGPGYIRVYCNNKKPEVSLNIKLVVFRT